MCKLSQRRQEAMVTVFTYFTLILISFLFAICFYFCETIEDRLKVGAGFTFFIMVSYFLRHLENWISKVESNRGNYRDEKETVSKLV